MVFNRRSTLKSLLAAATLAHAAVSAGNPSTGSIAAGEEVRRQNEELRAWLASEPARSAAAGNRRHALAMCRASGELNFLSMLGASNALVPFLLATGVRRVLDGEDSAGWTSIRDSVQLSTLWWRAITARAHKEKLSSLP